MVGTGSSGIQSIPVIAQQASHVVVFQRTPNFSLPARNEPLAPATQAEVKADYRALRDTARSSFSAIAVSAPTEMAMEVEPDERQRRYEAAWALGGLMSVTTTFRDLILDKAANDTAADFIRSKISELVDDPEVARVLTPTDHPFATKRPCLDTGYFETFNRDNVTLVDLRQTPITEIVPSGIRTTAGVHELDCIVFATGFDAMTGPLLRVDIRGRGDRPLSDKWSAGPRTYLGIATAGSPTSSSSRDREARRSSATWSWPSSSTWTGSPTACRSWRPMARHHRGHRRRRGRGSTTSTSSRMPRCSRGPTWYMGANVPGKPRVFLPYVGGFPQYRSTCDDVAADGYRGLATVGPAPDPR